MWFTGKYKENELVLPFTVEKSSSTMFAMKQSKLREHINTAVRQALHASQIAQQKTEIAIARLTEIYLLDAVV